MTMHENSLAAHVVERKELQRRRQEILGCLYQQNGEPMTDREIMERLEYKEPNSVRPRITELIGDGLVSECGSTVCLKTGRTVRLVTLRLVTLRKMCPEHGLNSADGSSDCIVKPRRKPMAIPAGSQMILGY